MLKFIGTGSAFNQDLGNTSAYIKDGETLLLIDCGETVFQRIKEIKLLDDVKKVYIAFKGRKNITDIEFNQNKLKVYINLKKGMLEDPLSIAQDITEIGHWGNGDYRVEVSSEEDIDNVMPLIKQSLKVNKK